MNFLSIQGPAHLDQKSIIEAGSFYTPRHLVDEVGKMIQPYLDENDNPIIFDSSVGGGAFTQLMDGYDYRMADSDAVSCNILSAFADRNRVFHSNSLHEVSREKYLIPEDAYLIQIGNPPYNDTTSAYKKGEKGANECDPDLFDRDLGVSFLRSYAKLDSNLVCVLHPLAYLVKETNFKRLRTFRENYILRDAVIFSSSTFSGTGKGKFPIIIGLYEKNHEGMDYEFIRDFQFRILDTSKTFQLSKHETTDGFITKYPPRKNDPKESPIGLYYYTFRDINSLLRSASFQTQPHYNAIVVTLENLYQYAYLFALRSLFNPTDRWLYGNLSPLIDRTFVEEHQSELVRYAMAQHPAFSDLPEKTLNQIRSYYGVREKEISSVIVDIEAELKTAINQLVD